MNNIPVKRISGTFVERYVRVALPVPVLVALYVVVKNGTESTTILGLALGVGLASLLVWLVDCEAAGSRKPVRLIDGDVLIIGTDHVPPDMILSITPIRGNRRSYGGLIEIAYKTMNGTKTANVLSKPGFLGPFAFTRRTLALLLNSHPTLKARVNPERTD